MTIELSWFEWEASFGPKNHLIKWPYEGLFQPIIVYKLYQKLQVETSLSKRKQRGVNSSSWLCWNLNKYCKQLLVVVEGWPRNLSRRMKFSYLQQFGVPRMTTQILDCISWSTQIPVQHFHMRFDLTTCQVFQ